MLVVLVREIAVNLIATVEKRCINQLIGAFKGLFKEAGMVVCWILCLKSMSWKTPTSDLHTVIICFHFVL